MDDLVVVSTKIRKTGHLTSVAIFVRVNWHAYTAIAPSRPAIAPLAKIDSFAIRTLRITLAYTLLIAILYPVTTSKPMSALSHL